MSKPTVYFSGPVSFENWGTDVEVGYLFAHNHPLLGEAHVRTSEVVKKYEDGSFETLNTMYVPVAVIGMTGE